METSTNTLKNELLDMVSEKMISIFSAKETVNFIADMDQAMEARKDLTGHYKKFKETGGTSSLLCSLQHFVRMTNNHCGKVTSKENRVSGHASAVNFKYSEAYKNLINLTSKLEN